MDFAPTDDQRLIIDTVRAFAEKELAPRYAYWDQQEEFPREQWRKMGDLGLFGREFV